MHLVLPSQLRPEALTLTDLLPHSVRSRGKGSRSNSNSRGEEGGKESWDRWCWTQEASLDSSAEMLTDQKASGCICQQDPCSSRAQFSTGGLGLREEVAYGDG